MRKGGKQEEISGHHNNLCAIDNGGLFSGIQAASFDQFMIAKYVRRSLIFGAPGLLLQIGCTFVANDVITKAMSIGGGSLLVLTGVFVFGTIAGNILLIAGLGFYAKAKGYSAVLGVLGLLSCIGLLILAILPDRSKGAA